MIRIRPATQADVLTIWRKVIGAGLDPTSLDWRRFMLAFDSATGRVVGCAQIKRYEDCDEFGSLVVDVALRGQGIGGALLTHLVSQATGDLYLVCLDKMRPYYERFGFRVLDATSAPRTLRVKVRAGRLLGVRVVCMVLSRDRVNTRGQASSGPAL
jgi:N-acetylglutamate synthase-like GNAT family acetyltransferase